MRVLVLGIMLHASSTSLAVVIHNVRGWANASSYVDAYGLPTGHGYETGLIHDRKTFDGMLEVSRGSRVDGFDYEPGSDLYDRSTAYAGLDYDFNGLSWDGYGFSGVDLYRKTPYGQMGGDAGSGFRVTFELTSPHNFSFYYKMNMDDDWMHNRLHFAGVVDIDSVGVVELLEETIAGTLNPGTYTFSANVDSQSRRLSMFNRFDFALTWLPLAARRAVPEAAHGAFLLILGLVSILSARSVQRALGSFPLILLTGCGADPAEWINAAEPPVTLWAESREGDIILRDGAGNLSSFRAGGLPGNSAAMAIAETYDPSDVMRVK